MNKKAMVTSHGPCWIEFGVGKRTYHYEFSHPGTVAGVMGVAKHSAWKALNMAKTFGTLTRIHNEEPPQRYGTEPGKSRLIRVNSWVEKKDGEHWMHTLLGILQRLNPKKGEGVGYHFGKFFIYTETETTA